MGGSASIITDPIFQGMAISLLFGAAVSTALTLVVIPLACARAQGAYSARPDEFDEALAAEVYATPACAAHNPARETETGAAIRPKVKELAANAFKKAQPWLNVSLEWVRTSIRSLFGEGALKPFQALRTVVLAVWTFVVTGWRSLFIVPQGHAFAGAIAGGSALVKVATAPVPASQEAAAGTNRALDGTGGEGGLAGEHSSAANPAPAGATVSQAASQPAVPVEPNLPAAQSVAQIEHQAVPASNAVLVRRAPEESLPVPAGRDSRPKAKSVRASAIRLHRREAVRRASNRIHTRLAKPGKESKGEE
jgi:hypothetical protein